MAPAVHRPGETGPRTAACIEEAQPRGHRPGCAATRRQRQRAILNGTRRSSPATPVKGSRGAAVARSQTRDGDRKTQHPQRFMHLDKREYGQHDDALTVGVAATTHRHARPRRSCARSCHHSQCRHVHGVVGGMCSRNGDHARSSREPPVRPEGAISYARVMNCGSRTFRSRGWENLYRERIWGSGSKTERRESADACDRGIQIPFAKA